MMIVAHRGASGDAPENTLASFELAWRQGADAIEGDFRLTKDGAIVCIHDADTARVSDQSLIVIESTLQQLKRVDIGSYRGEQFAGERIPTLDEVIATIPDGKKILIEIKCETEIVATLINQLQQSKLTAEQVVIIAFDARVIRACKDLAPEYEANWLNDFSEDFEVDAIISTLLETGAEGLSSNNEKTKELADAVLDLGLAYHAGWTMDNPELARKIIGWGALSITTNNPYQLRQNLNE